jgi:hypothetical protein
MRHSTLLLTKSEQNVNIILFICAIRAKSTKIMHERVVVYPYIFLRISISEQNVLVIFIILGVHAKYFCLHVPSTATVYALTSQSVYFFKPL